MENRQKLKNMKNKVVRKKLLEYKEKQDRVLVESLIVENRMRTLFESYDAIGDLNNLSKTNKIKLAEAFYTELRRLDESNLLNEQLFDALKSILGGAFEATIQSLIEPIMDSFLSWIGLKSGFFKNFLITFFSRNPLKFIEIFKGCDSFTKTAVEALCEALILLGSKQLEGTSTAAAAIRNALMDAFASTEFHQKMAEGLSEPICDLYEKFFNKAKDVKDKLIGKEPEAAVA